MYLQDEFIKLLEIWAGDILDMKDDGVIGLLSKSCDKLNKNKKEKTRLKVDLDGNEPCPFGFSGGENNLAQMVLVGLNPGKPLSNHPKFRDIQDVVKYCVPENEISKSDNMYKFLANRIKETKFYQDVFLIHHALFSGARVYDKFSDIEVKYKNREIEELFLERFEEYPVINAELIPYKSTEYGGIDACLTNENYMLYIRRMLDMIIKSTNKNAYIIFYGEKNKVKKLLYKIDKDTFSVWQEYMLEYQNSKNEGTCSVYFSQWEEERTVILLPSRSRRAWYTITELVKRLKEFRANQH